MHKIMQSYSDDIWRSIEADGIYLLRLNKASYEHLRKDLPPPPIDPLIWHFLSGGFAGTISRTVTAPIDRVRLIIQMLPNKLGAFEVTRLIIKEGGVLSLWRGNLLSALKVGPEMAFRFTAYERIKHLISETPTHPIFQRSIAGACAGIIGNTIIYPMEVMKTRMTIRRSGEYTGVFDAIKKIYAKEGPKAFYRGYPTSCMGLIPYTGIDLALFETLKREYVYKNLDTASDRMHVIWKAIPCGIISTTLAQCVAYPFHLMKFRQQGRSRHPSNLANKKYFFAWFSIMTHIVKEEGVFGLYRGIIPTLCKVVPASSINYFIYESIQNYLRSVRK